MRKLTSLLITASVMISFALSREHVSNAKPLVPSGLKNLYVTSLVMDSQKNLYAGTFGGVFKTAMANPNATANWEDFNNGFPANAVATLDVRALAVSDNLIYAGAWGGGVFQSSLGAANWTQIGALPGKGGLGDLHVHSLKLDSGGNLWATTSNGIFRRKKGDFTWIEVTKGLGNLNVKSLVFDSQGDAYAATWGAGVFKSTAGSPWTSFNTGLKEINVFHLTTDTPGTYIYAATQSGVFRIASTSKTWTAYNTGLTDPSVKAIAVDSMGNLFAATVGGVMKSGIPNSNWTIYHPEITNPDVNTLFIDPAGNLFAGTSGSGVFKIPLTSWTGFS